MKKTSRFTNLRRTSSGTSLIELGVIAIILPIMAVICVNLGLAVFSAGIVDGACKDAARAAGQRTDADDALYAAKAIVARYAATSGVLIGTPTVTCNYYTGAAKPGDPEDINSGPNATVTVTSTVKLLVPIVFNGAALTDKITFSSVYSFPILGSAPDLENETEITENPKNLTDAKAQRDLVALEVAQNKLEADEEDASLVGQAAADEQVKYDALADKNSPLYKAILDAENAYNAAFEKADKQPFAKDEFDAIKKALDNVVPENPEKKNLYDALLAERNANIRVKQDETVVGKATDKLEDDYGIEAPTAKTKPPAHYDDNNTDGGTPPLPAS